MYFCIMKVDYIIVGLGLAGLSFAEELQKNNKSFVVYEDNSQTSSLVAGGVYNPVVLKRFTPVWRAAQQLSTASLFYRNLEEKFNTTLDQKFSTRKAFKNIEDQNNWYTASDKPLLAAYMNPKIINKSIEGVVADYGFGEVYQTGRIYTGKLVTLYRVFLQNKNLLYQEKFDHSGIIIEDHIIKYKEIKASKIVFCEGFGMKENPFFNYLPLKEAKGELLTIYAPDLHIDFLLKSNLFVLPLGNHQYKVGATFDWVDKTSIPSEKGKKELIERLEKVLHIPYKIIEHTAGIRPTVKDRRPLLGEHPKHKNLVIFNGLGTRGVMIAPWAAKQLYDYLEKSISLSEELNINRFEETYFD